MKELAPKEAILVAATAMDARSAVRALTKRLKEAVAAVNGEFGEWFAVEAGSAGADAILLVVPTERLRVLCAALDAAQGERGAIERSTSAQEVFQRVFGSGHEAKGSRKRRKLQPRNARKGN